MGGAKPWRQGRARRTTPYIAKTAFNAFDSGRDRPAWPTRGRYEHHPQREEPTLAEVSSINAKSIVDTAVTQFKTAIQEALTSEVARVQGLLGAAQTGEAATAERFAVARPDRAERTCNRRPRPSGPCSRP